ncbi:hypothetical protein EYF80_025660 [Liparis tanakae]|uniref:Uncharacterized protein n=1 Tax=Liparis tanakae TaxID=230148 RepID=A0A4Z2HH30_9TELE|nr:hypothetical protein EYF80_025660 [Liparis tanakae]
MFRSQEEEKHQILLLFATWSNEAKWKWKVSGHLHCPPEAFRTRVFFFITTCLDWCISTLTKKASEVETNSVLVEEELLFFFFFLSLSLSLQSGSSTLGDWGGGRREVLGGEDLDLDASVDRLKTGGLIVDHQLLCVFSKMMLIFFPAQDFEALSLESFD